jgi:hypothetical protein
VALVASAITKWSTGPVVLTNLSSTGAKLRGRELPSWGEVIVVQFAGSVDEFGKVVWKEQNECGITFDAPLSSKAVDRLKRHGDLAVVLGISDQRT